MSIIVLADGCMFTQNSKGALFFLVFARILWLINKVLGLPPRFDSVSTVDPYKRVDPYYLCSFGGLGDRSVMGPNRDLPTRFVWKFLPFIN